MIIDLAGSGDEPVRWLHAVGGRRTCSSPPGLARRARIDAKGNDETHFLDPLIGIAESRRTPADELLTGYEGRWRGSVDPAFDEEAY